MFRSSVVMDMRFALRLFCNWLIFKFFYNDIWPHFFNKIVIYCAASCVIITLYIALCRALWLTPRPFLHCVFVPCLVPLISLCPRERLVLRLDLRSPLLLMQSPFLVQLMFAFVHRSAPCVSSCGAVCAGHCKHYELLNIRASKHRTFWT